MRPRTRWLCVLVLALACAKSAPTPVASPTAASSPTASAAAGLEDGRHPVYLTKIDATGRTLTFDLIQFLTGSAARDAYQKDTGESDGPPNDYYIVNENKRLRTMPVSSDAAAKVLTEGTPDTHSVTWQQFTSQPRDGKLFWLTVRGQTITGIEEQYVP